MEGTGRGAWRTALIGVLAVVVLGLGAVADTALGQGGGRNVTVEAMRSEQRLALVIGNARYAPPADLKNPLNDAQDMAAVLRVLGFKVILQTDADLKGMQRAVREFGASLRPDGVGLFYYAGHGVQVRGNNYLVPIGAKFEDEDAVEDEALDANRVLKVMEDSRSRVSIVILDACRDNPFVRSFKRSTTRGLAQMSAPSGSFIAYATGPGATAADGGGRNGLFTSEVLTAIRTPGVDILDVFRQVIGSVRESTSGRQVPWTLSSLDGYFYFALPGKAGPRVAIAPPPPPPAPPRVEVREEVGLGTLAVSSRMAGVDVWLGEQKIGTTRSGGTLVVSNLPAGTHRITARKDGHRAWEREVEIAANQRSDVVIDIAPLGAAPAIKGGDDAEMVLIPAGEFWMGSAPAEVERECKKAGVAEASCKRWVEREAPRHRVHVDGFYLDRYEVTNALFERFVRATSHRTTAEREGDGYALKDGAWQKVAGATWRAPNGPGTSVPSDHPVVQVSWDDAQAYCRWAGKRLPTEAEWEKAARGTDGRPYPWGEDWDPSRSNGLMSVKTTTAVGTYANGVSPYGVHDMAGNALEWVADWFGQDYYTRSPERNPTGPETGTSRVLRGGSFYGLQINLRAALRSNDSPGVRSYGVGFRCARGLLP